MRQKCQEPSERGQQVGLHRAVDTQNIVLSFTACLISGVGRQSQREKAEENNIIYCGALLNVIITIITKQQDKWKR